LWRARRHNGLVRRGSIRAFRFRKIALLKNAAEQKTFLLLLFFLGKKRRINKTKAATKSRNHEINVPPAVEDSPWRTGTKKAKAATKSRNHKSLCWDGRKTVQRQ
jgi:hypothetical protein